MTTNRKILNVLIGVAIMLFAGIIYGWSIFAAQIAGEFQDWSKAQLTLTFTLSMSFFCLGGLVSGIAGSRLTTRVRLMIAAGLFCTGFLLTARIQNPWSLYFSYGVLCGSGSGFVYNALMTTIPRYTPARQGLVSGILLLGFGASSLVLGSTFTSLTTQGILTWRVFFTYLGILNASVLVIGAFLLHLPPIEESKSSAVIDSAASTHSAAAEYTPRQMIGTSSFWLFFLWAALLSVIGLAVISQAQPIAVIVGSGGVRLGVISFIVGMIAVFNGLGRAFFGNLFDKLGWKKTMRIISLSALLGTSILVSALMLNIFALTVIGFLITGAAYGGSAISCAAYIKQSYGSKNFPINLQIALLNLLPASFGGTFAGMIYDRSGSYVNVLLVLIACSVLAFLIVGLIGQGKRK